MKFYLVLLFSICFFVGVLSAMDNGTPDPAPADESVEVAVPVAPAAPDLPPAPAIPVNIASEEPAINPVFAAAAAIPVLVVAGLAIGHARRFGPAARQTFHSYTSFTK